MRYEEILGPAVRLQLRGYRGASLEILCHDLDTTLYRDLVDVSLTLSGVNEWTWVDREGRKEAGRGFVSANGRLIRELVWELPQRYVHHRRQVSRLEGTVFERAEARELRRGLYIRSDHWFGVTAGGSVGHVAGVIRGIRKLGIDLEVVSTDELPGVSVDERFHLLKPEYDRVRNVPEIPRVMYNDTLVEFIRDHWDSWNPHFIYNRYSLHSYIGPLLRREFNVPFVCEFNGSLVWTNRNWSKRPLFFEGLADRIESMNLHAADLVVVGSETMADNVRRRGIADDRILVNPNSVDTDVYTPEVDGDPVRDRYGIGDRVVVGFIGTFGAWHGAEVLVEAAAKIVRGEVGGDTISDSEEVHFLMIGDGPGMGSVKELVEEHRLASYVTLTGLIPQDAGPAHLAACDILVSPHVPNPDGTPFFGSPTKLFEYLAMGRAIVASDLAQIGDVLEDGETGVLVKPADVEALARGILRLVSDPVLRERLGRNARRVAEGNHTWQRHSLRILESIQDRMAMRGVRERDCIPE